jgi:nuclear pore complex protein Nup93
MLSARSENLEKQNGGGSSSTLSDVRANIARLEARARSMLSGSDNQVLRSGRSVFEHSKSTLAESSRRPSGATVTQHTPVELFMANLGFDMQEQQRLLQQLQMQVPKRSALNAGYDEEEGNLFFQGRGGASVTDTAIDLDAFVASRRSECLQRCVDDVHRQISDRTRELAEQQINAMWERRSDAIVEALEGRSLGGYRPGTQPSSNVSNTSYQNITNVNSTDINRLLAAKMHAFAHVVDVAQPQEWCSHFNAFAQETAPAEGDETSSLWFTVSSILAPVSRSVTSSAEVSLDGVKKYVASSRLVLERKFLASIFTEVLKIPISKFEEMEHMHAEKVVDVIEQYVGRGADVWSLILTAMRCGRYDAAHVFASRVPTGVKAPLQAALAAIDGTPQLARNDMKPFVDLRSYFLEEVTRSSYYRTAVLFMLLVGTVSQPGQDSDSVLAHFVSAIDRVSNSIEDMLWMRLMCIRQIEASSLPVQSLLDLQQSVLADIPQLLALPGSTSAKVASVLFYTLLPSTALRLLQDSREFFCDAVHMALSFHVSHLLRCTSAESQLNLSSLLQAYACKALEMEDLKVTRHVAPTLFRYFWKSDSVEAFVEMCRNSVICVKLFGQLGDGVANEGALLHSSAACQPELLATMDTISDAAAAAGQVELAVHILLVLDRLAVQQRDVQTSQEALRKATLTLNPALSHSAHYTSGSSVHRENLVLYSRRLKDRLQNSAADVGGREVQAFYHLCLIAEFHSLYHKNQYDQAVTTFLQLRFLPTQASDVDDSAEQFNTSVSDDVVTAMPPTVVLFLKLELSLLKKLSSVERAPVIQMAKAIIRWVSKWRFNARKDLMRELQSVESQFDA